MVAAVDAVARQQTPVSSLWTDLASLRHSAVQLLFDIHHHLGSITTAPIDGSGRFVFPPTTVVWRSVVVLVESAVVVAVYVTAEGQEALSLPHDVLRRLRRLKHSINSGRERRSSTFALAQSQVGSGVAYHAITAGRGLAPYLDFGSTFQQYI